MSLLSTRRFRIEDLYVATVYRLLSGIFLSRPNAFVSRLSVNRVPNLAPLSFFSMALADPPTLRTSIDLRYVRQVKDMIRNIKIRQVDGHIWRRGSNSSLRCFYR